MRLPFKQSRYVSIAPVFLFASLFVASPLHATSNLALAKDSLADTPPLKNVTVEKYELQITSAYQHFFYREYASDSEKLNEERGWMPSVALKASYQWHENILIGATAEWAGDSVDYRGQTNLGSVFNTQTEERFHQYALFLSKIFFYDRPLIWKSSLAWREWERDIQSRGIVKGLYEVYRWGEVRTGLLWQYGNYGAWTHDAGLNLSYTLDPEIKVDLRPNGFNKVTMGLRDKLGWGAGFTSSYRFSERYALLAAVSYEYWRFGASDTAIVSGSFSNARVREPESESGLWKLGLGLQAIF